MVQRISNFERQPRDCYETPEWCSQVILPFIPEDAILWEPACASGKMSRALGANYSSDIVTDYGVSDTDFLTQKMLPYTNDGRCTAIVTNPPFHRQAEKFIRHGLNLLSGTQEGFMAMLLPIDFDSAKTRRDMFMETHGFMSFAGKVVLTSRVVWFERDDVKTSPTTNHAWYFWKQWYDYPQIFYHHK